MRNSLFISHCTPEDNQFVLWLGTRLQLTGYNVWYDLDGLLGGERDFLNPIDEEIRNNSIKFLLVVSNLTFKKDGVLDEFEFAKSIAKKENIDNFIIPLRIEDVPYDLRVGQNRYNHIDFTESWAQGLKKLLKKLENDNVPQKTTQHPISIWYQNDFTIDRGILNQKEYYYTNLWPIKTLPEQIFMFQYDNEKQAEAIFKNNPIYPIIRHGNVLVSFNEKINSCISDENLQIDSSRVFSIEITKIISGFNSDNFPTLTDSENLLKRLLNRTFHLIMKQRGLFWYELSNKVNCYFYPNRLIEKNKCLVNYPNRKKRKNLIGSFNKAKWHFAISNKSQLKPLLCFSLKSHILFSNDGFRIWDDKNKLHAARRKKGKRWFNEEWRDQLMAFITGLKNDESKIEINLSDSFKIEMPLLTYSLISNYGYIEPISKDRQDVINDLSFEEEYFNKIDE